MLLVSSHESVVYCLIEVSSLHENYSDGQWSDTTGKIARLTNHLSMSSHRSLAIDGTAAQHQAEVEGQSTVDQRQRILGLVPVIS